MSRLLLRMIGRDVGGRRPLFGGDCFNYWHLVRESSGGGVGESPYLLSLHYDFGGDFPHYLNAFLSYRKSK